MGGCTPAEGKKMKVIERIKYTERISRYLKYVKRHRASDKIVLIQIGNQENYSRWIAPLLTELKQWGKSVQELYAVCPKELKGTIENSCGTYGKSLQYCEKDSREYDRLLCRAGLIITDDVFPDNYIKKKSQLCVRVGNIAPTPEKNSLGTVQRTLLLCDYIAVESETCGRQMLSDYYLEQLYCGLLLPDSCGDKWWTNILGTQKECEELQPEKNGKQNVLIYPGGLGENGITRSFYNLLDSIDLSKRNYYVCFREKYMREMLPAIEALPTAIGIVGWAGDTPMTIAETIAYVLRFKVKAAPGILDRVMDRIYIRESGRRFQSLPIDVCIQFAGYEKEMIRIFRFFKGHRIIYVHNDMVAEAKKKGNQDWLVLRDAYRNYDRVAAVAEGIVAPTVEISGRRDNIAVVPNCQNFQSVLVRAEEEVILNEWTDSSVSVDKLREILSEPGKKFLNIGRYSPEKGHQMLVDAFSKYWDRHRDSWLIIIGGEGSCYEETRQYVREAVSKDHIVLIKSMGNPMPVMKKCDVFVLSSLYEGLPMVFFEADMLKLPIISTDIPGPREFMKQYNGYLTSPDSEGLYRGMNDFHEGKVRTLGIDFGEYNKDAANAFEDLYL